MPYAETTLAGLESARAAILARYAQLQASLRSMVLVYNGLPVADPACAASLAAIVQDARDALASATASVDAANATVGTALAAVELQADDDIADVAVARAAANAALDNLESLGLATYLAGSRANLERANALIRQLNAINLPQV